MGACFRLRRNAAGQSHRLRLPETVILPRRYFAPQRSHTEKRRLDGWHTEKATARLLCAKAAQRKGGEQRTLSTGTSCAKESHRKAQARWMAHRKGYGKASLRKSGAQKRGEQRTLSTGTSCVKESHRKTQARWVAHRKGYGKASLRKSGAKKGGA